MALEAPAGYGARWAPVWRSVAALAETWSSTLVVRRYAAQLPRNARQRTDGVPGRLQHVEAGFHRVSAESLRLATLVGFVAANGLVDLDGKAMRSFLDDALRIEQAFRLTIAWLRAQLPGYPMLPAPQLVRGTPLTTTEFTFRIVWTPDERRAGLHLVSPPSTLAEYLGAPDSAPVLGQQVRAVAEALSGTAEWSAFERASTALTAEDREQLRAANVRLRGRLTADVVDAYEADNALRRDAYRHHETAEAVGILTAGAHAFADAFDAVDRAIELTADVFTQLVAYGKPRPIPDTRELVVGPGARPTVSFSLHNPERLTELGQLSWLSDPLIEDAVHVIGMQMNYNFADGATEKINAVVLPGSAAAWKPSR